MCFWLAGKKTFDIAVILYVLYMYGKYGKGHCQYHIWSGNNVTVHIVTNSMSAEACMDHSISSDFFARIVPFHRLPSACRACDTQNKEKNRRKCKGRCFCSGERIYSILCHASCFARTILNNRMTCNRMISKKSMNSSNSSKSSCSKQLPRQGIQ